MSGTKTRFFAYDGAVLAKFVEHHTKLKTIHREVRRGRRRFVMPVVERWVNGIRWNHDISGRMLNRWTKQEVEVSKPGAARLLGDYELTTLAFERWARRNGMQPILRDLTKEGTDARKKNRGR